jgi:hypothetical protein
VRITRPASRGLLPAPRSRSLKIEHHRFTKLQFSTLLTGNSWPHIESEVLTFFDSLLRQGTHFSFRELVRYGGKRCIRMQFVWCLALHTRADLGCFQPNQCHGIAIL